MAIGIGDIIERDGHDEFFVGFTLNIATILEQLVHSRNDARFFDVIKFKACYAKFGTHQCLKTRHGFSCH